MQRRLTSTLVIRMLGQRRGSNSHATLEQSECLFVFLRDDPGRPLRYLTLQQSLQMPHVTTTLFPTGKSAPMAYRLGAEPHQEVT